MNSFVFAQEFNAEKIPDSLTTGASVVKRYEEMILEIKSPGKFVSHERHVYTILNASGDDFATYKSYYDQFTTIDAASGKLYDSRGKEIRHVKKKDMPDLPDIDGYSLIQDERYISNDFAYRTYPYTVDYEEDDTQDGVLSFPGWSPVKATNLSVQYSKYVIIAPSDYQVRYKELNFNSPPVITEKGGKKTYVWEMQNIPAHKWEAFAPASVQLFPYMMVAPSDFEAQGYNGNMSTWANYGKFIFQLRKGRDVLPDDVKKEVHELTDRLTDTRQKIKALYEFLQKNTHYISIQLGIGGWQPFDATYVATKKYGDCKALSNYMVALLKEAGINGKYVEIKAESNASPIVTDFSESQFNHVICCVPLQKDTMWLECTSQTLPAGYLSAFTQDRWALLVDENGGTLVHTPKYGYKDNTQTRQIKATINEFGNLTCSVASDYTAMQQDDLFFMINTYSNDKMLEYLKSNIELPTFDINNLHYTQHKEMIPSIEETMNILASNYAQVTGKRLFINPNILTKADDRITEDENRKYNVELHDEYTSVDSVEIQIPSGYTVESPFRNINLQTKFGKFVANVKIVQGKIFYYREQEHYSGRFPSTDYNAFVAYCQQIYKSDHSKVVFVKND